MNCPTCGAPLNPPIPTSGPLTPHDEAKVALIIKLLTDYFTPQKMALQLRNPEGGNRG